MRGCMKGKSPEKDAEKTGVRGDKGAFSRNSTLPFGREAARGRIWAPILAPFWYNLHHFRIAFSSIDF